MRYSYILHFPQTDPHYDDLRFRWQTFLGRFVLPIYRKYPDLRFWCSFYGSFIRFRVHTHNRSISRDIARRVKGSVFRFDKAEEENVTLVSDLGASRFISQSASRIEIRRRANMVLDYLSSITKLYLDGLVEIGEGRWDYRKTVDGENPNGSDFESLHHLLCHITRVPTPVFEFELKGRQGLDSLLSIVHQAREEGAQAKITRRHNVHF